MLESTISKICPKVFKFFTHTAQEKAVESRFKIRESKLTPVAFMHGLIETCFSGQFDLETFRYNLKKQKVSIKKQSLFERFNERTVNFVQAMATAAMAYFDTEHLPRLGLFEPFLAVNIIDSSTVSLHHALRQVFKGCGGSASSAAVKIQVLFDHLNGQLKDLALTSGRDNDQGFDAFLNDIQENALYLMDLGYFKLASFKKIIAGKAFFVSRLLTGTQLLTSEGEPLVLLDLLAKSPNVFSQQLLMGVKAKIPVRAVFQRLSASVAAERRRKLNKEYRRRGITPSKELLALQDWSIYITNTTEAQISNKDIHTAYTYRWQIELTFKLSKSLMQIDSINTTKPCRVRIEIYAKFIAMMLLFLLISPVRYQHDKEISFYKACKRLIDMASDFIRALGSLYRLKKFVRNFTENLALFAIKDIKKKPPCSSVASWENDF